MASKVGTIDASLSTGNVAYSSIGFQPTFLMLWSSPRATPGASDDSQGNISRGMTDGITTGGHTVTARSNGLQIAFRRSTAIYEDINWNGNVVASADFVQFDADGFTLNWTDAADSGMDIHFLALGGAAFQGIYVGSTLLTGTGAHAVTGVGFQPDACIFLWSQPVSSVPTTSTSGETYSGMGFDDGVTTLAIGTKNQASSTSPARTSTSSGRSMYATRTTADAMDASISSMDSDGFTLSVATLFANSEVLFVAFKNADIAVGAIYTPAAPSDVAETGLGFQPDAVLLISEGVTGWDGGGSSTSNASADAVNMVGAFTATSQRTAMWARRSDSTTPNTGFSSSSTKLLQTPVTSHQPSAGGDEVLADLDSMDADGFTITYDTTASRKPLFYIAFAGGGVTGTFDNKIVYADGVTIA